MFCKKCGKEIGDNETYCTYCGAPQNDVPPQQAPPAYSANAPVDGSSFGWAFLGFLIPLVGLILFLVRTPCPSAPNRAAKARSSA